MPRLLTLMMGVMAAVIAAIAPAAANCCSSPARMITVANTVMAQAPGLQPVLRAELIAWRDAAKPMVAEVAAFTPASMTEGDMTRFYERVAALKDVHLAEARRLVPALYAAGHVEAALTLAHHVASSERCTPERRVSLLEQLAQAELPHAASLHPIHVSAREELTMACAVVHTRDGELPPPIGSDGFWQTCAARALDATDKAHADHFGVHHAVAEPLCGLAEPIPHLQGPAMMTLAQH